MKARFLPVCSINPKRSLRLNIVHSCQFRSLLSWRSAGGLRGSMRSSESMHFLIMILMGPSYFESEGQFCVILLISVDYMEDGLSLAPASTITAIHGCDSSDHQRNHITTNSAIAPKNACMMVAF